MCRGVGLGVAVFLGGSWSRKALCDVSSRVGDGESTRFGGSRNRVLVAVTVISAMSGAGIELGRSGIGDGPRPTEGNTKYASTAAIPPAIITALTVGVSKATLRNTLMGGPSSRWHGTAELAPNATLGHPTHVKRRGNALYFVRGGARLGSDPRLRPPDPLVEGAQDRKEPFRLLKMRQM